MEYYTTSRLIVALDAVNQGFEGCEQLYQWDNHDNFTPIDNARPQEWRESINCVGKTDKYVAWTSKQKWRFPKTPHNVALMQPLIGDCVMLFQNAFNRTYYSTMNTKEQINDTFLILEHGHPNIIYRNDKPFPSWDEEEM